MAELPLALWVLFVVLTLPMIDMATIGLRTTFLVAAAHDAVHAASRAKSFSVAVSANDPSATQTASSQVTQDISRFREITVTNVTTNMVITDISNGQTTRRTTPLPAPADINSNTYSLEVLVTANIRPLITFNAGGLLPGIPGLSAPVAVTCAAQEFSEYPTGLNQ